jgi:hypothetical protein
VLYASKETLDKLAKANEEIKELKSQSNKEIEELERQLRNARKRLEELEDVEELRRELSAARRVIQIQAKHHDEKLLHQHIKTNIIRHKIGLKPKGKSEIQLRTKCNQTPARDGNQSGGAVSPGGDHEDRHPSV